MKININDMILVKVYDAGYKIMLDDYNKIFESYPKLNLKRMTINDFKSETVLDGYSRMELWQFMRIFGEHCYNGQSDLFDNEILYIEE